MVNRNAWDNVVLVTRDGSTDATWDGKVKNLIYDVNSMAWIAQEAPSGGAASSVTVTNFPANPATSTLQTTGNATLASLLTELQAKADLSETQPISGTVTANAGTGTMAVSGPLTDAQLRAVAVPVSLPNNNVLVNGNSAFYATSLTALGTFFTEDFNGYKELKVHVFGTFVASIVIEGSGNNADWVSVAYLDAASVTAPPQNSAITAPGVFYVPLNIRWVRVRVSAYTSGTVTCFAVANTATGSPDLGAKFVTGPVTNTELRATPVPVSGTVTANAGTGTFAVSGPLTDTQIRATALPVSGPLTDAQLRSVAVPVSGTFYPTTQDVDNRRARTVLFASINAAASGANVIVAAQAANKIKVLSYSFVVDAAVTAKWQSAATDLSGAMSFSANGGISTPIGSPGFGWLFETAVNEALNLNLGGAVGVRGHLSYFLEA